MIKIDGIVVRVVFTGNHTVSNFTRHAMRPRRHDIGNANSFTALLPATFQLQLSLFILACNTIMKITPIMTMHGMKVTTFRILPFFHSFRGCCQSRCTIKTNSCFIIIRITCHRPQISVYNKHIHNRIPFHSSPHDTILVLFPFQVQGNSARYYSFLTWIIPYY